MTTKRSLKPGSFSQPPTRALDDKRLTDFSKLVLWCICTYTDGNYECFPGEDTIAERLGAQPRSVRRAIRQLEECGHLVVTPRKRPKERGGGFDSNLYRVLYGNEGEVETLPAPQEQPKPKKAKAPSEVPPAVAPPAEPDFKPPVAEPVDLWPIALVIIEVCGWSKTYGKHTTLAKAAAKSLAEFENFALPTLQTTYSKGGGWYTQDWRGQKGQKPTAAQIVDTWTTLTQNTSPAGSEVTRVDEYSFYA